MLNACSAKRSFLKRIQQCFLQLLNWYTLFLKTDGCKFEINRGDQFHCLVTGHLVSKFTESCENTFDKHALTSASQNRLHELCEIDAFMLT